MDHCRPKLPSAICVACGLAAAVLSATTIFAMADQVKRVPMGASPSRDPFCRDYANRTVGQVKESERLRCGFRGARWDTNFDRHWQWCMGRKSDMPNSEIAARSQELEDCIAAKRGAVITKPPVSMKDVTAPSAVTKPPVSSEDVTAPVDPADLGIKNKRPADSVLKRPPSEPH